jgi:hypothetical protein
MQNWKEHDENHERFVKSCLDELAARRAPIGTGPLPTKASLQSCETVVQSAVVQS